MEVATILNQTTAQTYYAQFDAPETVEIYMPEGVLDIPTYMYNQFIIEGENADYTVHLHFNATIKTTRIDYSSDIDWQKSWIQPAGGAQLSLADAQTDVVYYGDAFKAAKLEATVKDVQDVDYHIVIFTNCGRNYGTFEEETYNNGKRHLEASWDGMKFSFGDNNHLEEIYLRGDNYLRYYHMSSNPYDVLHIQLQFFPDPTKPGKIPTGVYPINGTQADGTVLLGRRQAEIQGRSARSSDRSRTGCLSQHYLRFSVFRHSSESGTKRQFRTLPRKAAYKKIPHHHICLRSSRRHARHVVSRKTVPHHRRWPSQIRCASRGRPRSVEMGPPTDHHRAHSLPVPAVCAGDL